MAIEKKRLKIILIDDNELSLHTMQKSFKLNGFNLDAETNPNIALEKHFHNNYDLILSDIMMPNLNGFQLTKLVKDRTPTTRVILFTGFFTKEKAEEGLRVGAEEVYPKPLPIIEILEKLKQY